MSGAEREAHSLSAAVPRMVEVLTTLGHRHALVGGLAVGVWVEPRATKDIDFVVSARVEDVNPLLAASRAAGFQVRGDELDRLKRAFMTRVWTEDAAGEPVMIDLLLNEHPFYASLLERSRTQPFVGTEISVAAPEDMLLLKLLAHRPQDLADAARLVEVHGTDMERPHLEEWAAQLGLEADLKLILAG